MSPQVQLVGKQALLKYPALTAEVQYLSDTQIHWKTTDDKGQVAEQTNALTLKSINPTQYFLSWVENDGTTVSQVVDTEKGTVTAFLTYDDNGKRVSQLLEGSFELKN
ncbi:MoaF-related domain-containing protein [Capnocytophaga sp. HP1101]